jgi:hypothetical protein
VVVGRGERSGRCAGRSETGGLTLQSSAYGARVDRRVVKNTQRNSRRCLRQGIAAVRQVRGRASEDYREVVMVREGTVRVNRYSPDDKRLGHHTGWLTFVLHYSTSVCARASNTGAVSKKSRSSCPTLCQHLADTLPDIHAATRVRSCVYLHGIPEQWTPATREAAQLLCFH